MVASRKSHFEYYHGRGRGPQEVAFRVLALRVLHGLGLKDRMPLPRSRSKTDRQAFFASHDQHRDLRLTPAEWQHLREYSDAMWRVKELPEGTAKTRWEATAASRLKKVPQYLRQYLPEPTPWQREIAAKAAANNLRAVEFMAAHRAAKESVG